jgi:hypothetical protein
MDRGAHFYRCDMQVHSPRDRRWSGSDCVSEGERKQYAVSLIRACREKGLDGIAVTDHDDLLFARYVREARGTSATRMGTRLRQTSNSLCFRGLS